MPFIAVDFFYTLATEDQNAGVVDIAPFDADVYADGDADCDRDFIVGSGIANHAEGRSVSSCGSIPVV